MPESDKIREEINRWRQEVSYWKEQCARVEGNERALIERRKELEAQVRKRQEELKGLQALKAELTLCERIMEQMLWQKQASEEDSSDPA